MQFIICHVKTELQLNYIYAVREIISQTSILTQLDSLKHLINCFTKIYLTTPNIFKRMIIT